MYGFQPHPLISQLSSYHKKKEKKEQQHSSAWWSFLISLGVIGGVFVASTGIGALFEAFLGAGMTSVIATDMSLAIGFSTFSAIKGDTNISTYALNFVFPFADLAVISSFRLYKYLRIAKLFNVIEKTEPFIETSLKKQLVKDLYKLSSAIKRGEITEDFVKQYKYAFRAIEQKYGIKFYNDFYDVALNWEMNVSKYKATQIAYRAMKTTDLNEKKALAELFLENPVYKKLIQVNKHWKIDTRFLTFNGNDLNIIAINEIKMVENKYKLLIHSLAKLDRILMNLDPFYAFRLLIKRFLFRRWTNLGFQRSIKEWMWDTRSLSKIKNYLDNTKKNLEDRFFRKRFLKKRENYHPFNDSEWVDGIEIKQSIPNFLPNENSLEALVVDIIVYFKKPKFSTYKWKEPVALYKLFYVRDVLPFLGASSKGQYYLKHFAWGWRIGKMLQFFKSFQGVEAVLGRNIFDLAVEAKWIYMDTDTVYNLYFKNHMEKMKKQFGKVDKEIERQLIWNFFWMLNLKFLGSPIAGIITENKNMFRQRLLSRTRSKVKIYTYKRSRHFGKYNNRVYKLKNKKLK